MYYGIIEQLFPNLISASDAGRDKPRFAPFTFSVFPQLEHLVASLIRKTI